MYRVEWKMPPKKTSGNAGIKKRISGKRKEREMSSDDEFDFEQENNKKPGRPSLKSGLQPVTVPDDVKEKIVGLMHTTLTVKLLWPFCFNNCYFWVQLCYVLSSSPQVFWPLGYQQVYVCMWNTVFCRELICTMKPVRNASFLTGCRIKGPTSTLNSKCSRLKMHYCCCRCRHCFLFYFCVVQKLDCPKAKGQLLIFGATNWDLIGRKEVPKQQGATLTHTQRHRPVTVALPKLLTDCSPVTWPQQLLTGLFFRFFSFWVNLRDDVWVKILHRHHHHL